MARKKSKSSAGSKSGNSEAKFSFSRRQWIIGAVGAVSAVGGGSALHAWDVHSKEQHDLAAIGEGTPVVVQIHDRSCPLCRRLKGVMGTVMDNRTDVVYRIADISTLDGSELQVRYNVPNVSLLFFDGEGKHRYTHTGLQTAEEINDLIDNVVGQMSAVAS